VPDIGFGEILVIVVLALLVFGPDRLPTVASDAARTLRRARRMAADARKDLVDASGISDDDEIAQTVRDLRELDPRNVMKDSPPDRRGASTKRAGSRPAKPGAARATGAGSPQTGATNPSGADPGEARNGTNNRAHGQAQQAGRADGVGGSARGGEASQAERGAAGAAPKPSVGTTAADPDWT
jgi:Tat protein translocase TatB subunit